MMSRPMKTHFILSNDPVFNNVNDQNRYKTKQVLIGNCLYLTTDHMSLKTLSYCHKLHVQRGYKTGLKIQS